MKPKYSADEILEALIESVKLQSHYAGILNDYDGGRRLQFDSAIEWLERLRKVGTTFNIGKP